jgi:hypothetical protein
MNELIKRNNYLIYMEQETIDIVASLTGNKYTRAQIVAALNSSG